MKVTILSGKTFEGTPTEIVHELARMDHQASTPKEYMGLVLRRIQETNGERIRTSNNYTGFLRSLKACGIISIEEDS